MSGTSPNKIGRTLSSPAALKLENVVMQLPAPKLFCTASHADGYACRPIRSRIYSTIVVTVGCPGTLGGCGPEAGGVHADCPATLFARTFAENGAAGGLGKSYWVAVPTFTGWSVVDPVVT